VERLSRTVKNHVSEIFLRKKKSTINKDVRVESIYHPFLPHTFMVVQAHV